MEEVHDTKHSETLGEYYPRMSTEVQTQNRPFRGFKAQKFDVVGSVALVLDETGTAKSELLVLG